MDLQVLTLNVWGLWLVSTRRELRMGLLARALERCTADVVLLQEVWVRADAELLQRSGAAGTLQHSFAFRGGALGTGLLLLSRHPIAGAAFHPFSARGDPAALHNGEFLTGKGVGWAALRTPAGPVDVFCTHLSANYAQRWSRGGGQEGCRLPDDSYAGVRVLQVVEVAEFVARRHSQGSLGTVVAGDFNAAPDTLEAAILQALLGLRDCWAEATPPEQRGKGFTANAPGNSYATAGAGHAPARIDYILTDGQPLAAELTLGDTGRGCSYSDHMGVRATVRLPAAGVLGGIQARGGAAPSLSAAVQRHPALFNAALERVDWGVRAMRDGKRAFMALAAALLAVGLACTGVLLAAPWWPAFPPTAHALLLTAMAVSLGAAGPLFVTGFVGRGAEGQALEQARQRLALSLADSTGQQQQQQSRRAGKRS